MEQNPRTRNDRVNVHEYEAKESWDGSVGKVLSSHKIKIVGTRSIGQNIWKDEKKVGKLYDYIIISKSDYNRTQPMYYIVFKTKRLTKIANKLI